MGRLSGRVVPVAEVDEATLRAMYALFARYYDCTSWEAFAADFREKDRVILLEDGEVRGFSTLREVRVEVDGREHVGMYSGDTVLDRPYWGSRVLGRVFLWHLFVRRLRHLGRPFWWVLITKGYKTYLMMANNFPTYHPAPGAPMPDGARRVRDAFGERLFGRHYRPERGLVVFDTSRGQLKPGVADPADGLRAQDPKVAFFEAANPTWRQGTELLCLAPMTLDMPFRYLPKVWRRGVSASARSEAA